MDSSTSTSIRFDIIKFKDLSDERTWLKLGEGSFGSVYRALYLGLPVAIKEILPRSDYDVEKYFSRECKISREARHPNIVQYIGLCLAPSASGDSHSASYLDTQREDNFLYGGRGPQRPLGNSRVLIISEYVPKGNLRAYLNLRSNSTNTQPLTWRLRISFAIDITRAMAYLHERKCLHRDLKLDNCLLTENLRVKLCDFGFARLEARNPEEVRRLSFCGTDGYMSPEILRGDPFGLSTDVYSLGIIFCELITMKLAGTYHDFDSESAFLERLPPRYSIKSSDVKSLLQAQDIGCPKSFIDLSLRCTQVNNELRPTIKEVLSALDSIEQIVINQERQTMIASRHVDFLKHNSIPSVGGFHFAKSHDKPGIVRSNFKRMPSFQGQVVITKSARPGSQAEPETALMLEGLKEKKSEKFRRQVNATESSFSLDPRLLTSFAHKKNAQTTGQFCKSTLKIPVAVSRKQLPSSFLKSTGCALPVECSSEFENTSTLPLAFSTESNSLEIYTTPPAIKTALMSEFVLSQLDLIPNISSQADAFSTVKSSFELAMEELEEAYKDVKVDNLGVHSNLHSDCVAVDGNIQSCKNSVNEFKTTTEGHDGLLDSEVTLAQDLSGNSSIILNHSQLKTAPLLAITSPVETTLLTLSSTTDLDPQLESKDLTPVNLNFKNDPKPEELMTCLPHRFTIIKLKWFTTLLTLNNRETFHPPKTEKVCGACHKKMSVRKTFLRCDDCGETCHPKCSDSLTLLPCKR